MRKHATKTCVFALLMLYAACTALSGQPLSNQEQERLIKAYDLTGRTWGLSTDLIKKFYEEDKDISDVVDDMSDIFQVVDILAKVSEAKDFEAFESVVLMIEDKLLSDRFKDIFPNASSALNWAGKARAAMQLLIDFVINPALLDNEVNQYIARREILLDPDDAVAGIRSWGNIKQQLLGEFRKQYGDLPFKETKPSGLVLLPAWNSRFDDYVTGWFETKYQDHKIKEFNANARKELAKRKAALEEKAVRLDYLIDMEMRSIDKLIITPSSATIGTDESIFFVVTAVNYKGEEMDVTDLALSDPVFASATPGTYSILAQYEGKDALAKITVEDQPVGQPADESDNPPPPPEGLCDGYANTEPFWDPGRNEYYCDCLPGFLWKPDLSGCEEKGKLLASLTDCSGYPNTRAVWDEASQSVICDCLPGYQWNSDFTQCYPQSLAAVNTIDCDVYPNTVAIWDPVRKQAYCDCIPGYKWRDDMKGCERITATQITNADCSNIPNTHQVYDPANDRMICDCLPGYNWNDTNTGCVPGKKRPAIDVNTLMNFISILSGAMNNNMPGTISPGNVPSSLQSPVVRQSRCNDTQKAGGDAPEVHQIDLGITSGSFRFDYQTFSVKDQIVVSQGGVVLFNSGCVGETRSVQIQFNGYTSVIEVRVNPNCSGSNNTAWNFTVHCPSL